MKYCTKCGTQVPDDSKFCTKCGSKLNGEPVESPAKNRKPVLAGIGAVLVVVVVVLVIVLSKGKGSKNPDIAASSKNVSVEKESGGTEKSGGFFGIGSGKKWEKEYAERLDAYLEYYEEHEKDSEIVLGYILINEDKLPYMVLNYGDGIDQEYVRNYISIVDYIDNAVQVVAEKQFDGLLVRPYLFDSACFLSYNADNGDGYTEVFFKLENGNFVKVDGTPILGGGYYVEDKFYYDVTSGSYTYIGRKTLKDYNEDAIYSGKREAVDGDFTVTGNFDLWFDEVLFYIGSERVSRLDFRDKLLSYNTAEDDANVEYGGLLLGIENFFFYDASFRNLLRELKEKPAGSVEELVGFYLKFVNSEYGGSGYSSKLTNEFIKDQIFVNPLNEDQGNLDEILGEKIEKYKRMNESGDSSPEAADADAVGDELDADADEDY